MILVFKEKLDKEASPGYQACLVLQDHLDLKEIVDTSEMLVHPVLVQWDQQVFQVLLAMWDLPVLVLLELKASEVLLASLVKEAYLADRDPLVPLATVNSVTICKLKQTDKQTKKDPKHFIMLSTLIESNIFYFIHTVVKSLKKYNLKKSLKCIHFQFILNDVQIAGPVNCHHDHVSGRKVEL